MAAKFGVPVCPHAGGVGLCEYVQHLAIFDYLRVGCSLDGPDGRVRRPPARALRRPGPHPRAAATCCPTQPGYSATMQPESIAEFSFPDGPAWRHDAASRDLASRRVIAAVARPRVRRVRPLVGAGQRSSAGGRSCHLGLGAFHRAHQAVYTEEAIAAAGGDWGIVGVAPRSTDGRGRAGRPGPPVQRHRPGRAGRADPGRSAR